MKNIKTWDRIKQEGIGYIYNDFGTQFPGDSATWNTTEFNKLHKTDCTYVKKMTYLTEGKNTKHFFKTREEANSWLKGNRSVEGYTLCKYCNP